jgi:hypothetical protein
MSTSAAAPAPGTPVAGAPAAPQPAGPPPTAPLASTNAWDFGRASLVVAALVFLTWYLVWHFGEDEGKATTVLGVVAPVLAAVVGVSLGYYTGSKTGQATADAATAQGQATTQAALAQGQQAAQTAAREATQRFVQEAEPLLLNLERHMENVLQPIEQGLASPAGRREFVLTGAPEHGIVVNAQDLDASRELLGTLRGLVARGRVGPLT